MTQNYLDIVREGKNAWWRYLLSIFLITFLWLIIGGITTIIALVGMLASRGVSLTDSESFSQQELEKFLSTPSTLNYAINHINFIFFFLGIFLAVKLLHSRKFLTLVSPEAKIKISRFFTGFGLWFFMISLLTGVSIWLNPENIEFVFDPNQWFPLIACAVILTPIQTSAEELFFRGYLIQGLSLITKQPFFLMVVSSLLFMFPHLGNPEVQRGPIWLALYYFSFGVFCSLITIKDNRLELALGVHAANNLFHVFISTKDSALPLPSAWLIKEPGDPKWSLFWLLGECSIFYLIVFGFMNRNGTRRVTSEESQRTKSKIVS